MTLTANWSYPTAVRFGAGRISELGEACKIAGIKRPLLVTDPGVAPLPITERALEAVRGEGLEVAVFS
ncbi:MAG: iron-containing alcohol dehydrogenase, partial [Aestuariivirgaceae bacterium]